LLSFNYHTCGFVLLGRTCMIVTPRASHATKYVILSKPRLSACKAITTNSITTSRQFPTQFPENMYVCTTYSTNYLWPIRAVGCMLGLLLLCHVRERRYANMHTIRPWSNIQTRFLKMSGYGSRRWYTRRGHCISVIKESVSSISSAQNTKKRSRNGGAISWNIT